MSIRWSTSIYISCMFFSTLTSVWTDRFFQQRWDQPHWTLAWNISWYPPLCGVPAHLAPTSPNFSSSKGVGEYGAGLEEGVCSPDQDRVWREHSWPRQSTGSPLAQRHQQLGSQVAGALVGSLQSTFHSQTPSKRSNPDLAKTMNSVLHSLREATLCKIYSAQKKTPKPGFWSTQSGCNNGNNLETQTTLNRATCRHEETRDQGQGRLGLKEWRPGPDETGAWHSTWKETARVRSAQGRSGKSNEVKSNTDYAKMFSS